MNTLTEPMWICTVSRIECKRSWRNLRQILTIITISLNWPLRKSSILTQTKVIVIKDMFRIFRLIFKCQSRNWVSRSQVIPKISCHNPINLINCKLHPLTIAPTKEAPKLRKGWVFLRKVASRKSKTRSCNSILILFWASATCATKSSMYRSCMTRCKKQMKPLKWTSAATFHMMERSISD